MSAAPGTTAPLISVAMCTYNGEKYLEQQLRSILDQSYPHLEIIVIDDCSRDATPQLLAQFQAQDPRIRVLHNPKNIGFVRNFERALHECRGQYIALADQDDIWLPHKLEHLLAEIGNNLLIYSCVALIDGDGHRIGGRFPRVNRIDGACALSLLLDNCVTGHACLLHRDLLATALPLPKTLFAHDQWLAIAAAASGRLKASGETLSLYRQHGDNAILGSKQKQRVSGNAKSLGKLQRQLGLAQAVLQADLLPAGDRQQLETFMQLLSRNQQRFYNFELARFLRRHGDAFLRLYDQPERALRKLCRGARLFRLLDRLKAAFV